MKTIFAVVLAFVALLSTMAYAQEAPKPQPESQTVTPQLFFHGEPHLFHPFHPHPFFHHPHLPYYPFPHGPLSSLPPMPAPLFYHRPFPFPFPSKPPTSSATNEEDMEVQLHFPSMPAVSEDQRECFHAVHNHGMVPCLTDFHSFILSQNPKVSQECCSALVNIQTACQPLVKHPLAMLNGVVARHCSASAPSPSN